MGPLLRPRRRRSAVRPPRAPPPVGRALSSMADEREGGMDPHGPRHHVGVTSVEVRDYWYRTYTYRYYGYNDTTEIVIELTDIFP